MSGEGAQAPLMVELNGVRKSYGGFEAVRGLEIQIRAGEVFGFLGPNGAGKTTTIKMLGGLLKPDHGSVKVGGIDMAADPVAAKRLLGYIPDRPFLYEKLTAWEFLRFIAGIYEMDNATFEDRAERMLTMFGMGRWTDNLIEGFSHGMKQRVVMAAAFLHDPKVLIVDEPMVGLDPAGARLTKEAFKDWAAQGNTVFLSTHTLEVAEEVCDRIAIIYKGKIIDQGTLDELRERHASAGASLEEVFLGMTGNVDAAALLQALRESDQ